MMSYPRTFQLKHESGFEYQLDSLSLEEGQRLVREKRGRYLEEYSKPDIDYRIYYLEDDDEIVTLSSTDAGHFRPAKGFFLQWEDTVRDTIRYKERTTKRILKGFPKERVFYTTDFVEILFEEISPEQATELAAQGNLLTKWYGKVPTTTISLFAIPDGRVLRHTVASGVNFHQVDPGQVFANQEEALLYQRYPGTNYRYQDCPLYGHNVYGEHFPDYVDALMEELGRLTDLNPAKFRYDIQELWCVHDRLRREVFTDRWVHQIFLPVIAYIGKVQMALYGGRWAMRYDAPFDTWVPMVVKGEKRNDFVRLLYVKSLLPDFEEYEFLGHALTHWRD